MRPVAVSEQNISSGAVALTGGLDESVTPLELKAGGLIVCLNYMEVDGGDKGYKSIAGYEVFDGTALASSVAGSSSDDTAREARRSAITAPTGINAIRGIHMYEGDVYAKRDDSGGALGKIYKATDSGWSALTLPATTVYAGGTCRWVNSSFSSYPTTSTYPPAMANTRCFFMVDGVSRPISYDGTTVRAIDAVELPSNSAHSPSPVFPTTLAEFDNRLWLAFPGGHLFYSKVGDPGTWTAIEGAGSIPTGDEITDLIVAPGNVLVVFMENSIKVVKVVDFYDDADYLYKAESFGGSAGGIAGTAKALLGDVYYIGDRGPTSMAATEKYGDFAAGSITRKVQKTFETNKSRLVTTVTHRQNNQYRLYFSDGLVLTLTFKGNRINSATRQLYSKAPVCITEGENSSGEIEIYFGAVDGFVYKSDSGTSFNGAEIPTKFATAFYHYRTPRRTKKFSRLTFELTAESGTVFYMKPDYDYRGAGHIKNVEQSPEVIESGGVWGSGVWGTFTWGGAYVLNPTLYISGYAVNMSVMVRTSSKYKGQHTVHNVIADYEILDQRM